MKDNKIIGDFMINNGVLITPDCNYSSDCKVKSILDLMDEEEIEDLEYHTSLDWLMPVVEKIEALRYWVRMDYGDVFIVDDDTNIIIENPMHEDGYTKLSILHKAVVEFIKWYNKNK